MKHLIFTSIIWLIAVNAFAQGVNNDSLQIQQQINKVTGLIGDRNSAFDEYTRSLNDHTGFLGNRSQQDEQNSNAILLGIVKSDDTIINEQNSLSVTFNAYVIKQKQINLNKADLSAVYLKQYHQEQNLSRLLLVGIACLVLVLLVSFYFLYRKPKQPVVRKVKPASQWKKL